MSSMWLFFFTAANLRIRHKIQLFHCSLVVVNWRNLFVVNGVVGENYPTTLIEYH